MGDHLDCDGIGDIEKLSNPVDHCFKTKRSINNPKRFFLLGDSHAVQFVFMANKVFKGSSFEVAYMHTGTFVKKYIKGFTSQNKNIDELDQIRNHAVDGDIVAISFHRGI